MSTTVLEALQNAQYNFEVMGQMSVGAKNNPAYELAMEQLENAIKALGDGRDAKFVIQESMADEVHV